MCVDVLKKRFSGKYFLTYYIDGYFLAYNSDIYFLTYNPDVYFLTFQHTNDKKTIFRYMYSFRQSEVDFINGRVVALAKK